MREDKDEPRYSVGEELDGAVRNQALFQRIANSLESKVMNVTGNNVVQR